MKSAGPILAGFVPSLYNMNYQMVFFGRIFGAVSKNHVKKFRLIIEEILCNLDLHKA